jgi:hypothetical protein
LNRTLWRTIVIAVLAAVAGALITLAITHKPAKETAEEAPKEQRVTVENGEPTIALDEKTQQTIGLATTTVSAARQSEQIQVFGTVIDVQELAAAQSQIAAAQAQLDQANARVSFDRAELTRLRALNADNRAVSDRAVQEAAATLASDESAVASATAAIRAAETASAQRFGPAVAGNRSLQADLFSMRSVLVQISVRGAAPRTISISTPESSVAAAAPGRRSTAEAAVATLISVAPRVDPKLQGASYFYLAPGGKLSAGMNIVAFYNGPGTTTGAALPPDAIVSWQGRSWVYVRRDATHFTRRDVSAGIAPGTIVVTTGAQQLLSEEMRSQLGEE